MSFSKNEANALLVHTTGRIKTYVGKIQRLERQLAQKTEHSEILEATLNSVAAPQAELDAARAELDAARAELDAARAKNAEQAQHLNMLSTHAQKKLEEMLSLKEKLHEQKMSLRDAQVEAATLRTDIRPLQDRHRQDQTTIENLRKELEQCLRAQNSASEGLPKEREILPPPPCSQPACEQEILSALPPPPSSQPACEQEILSALPPPPSSQPNATVATVDDKEKIAELENELKQMEFIIQSLQEELDEKTEESENSAREFKAHIDADKAARLKEEANNAAKQKDAEAQLEQWEKEYDASLKRAQEMHGKTIQTLEEEHAKTIQTLKEEHAEAIQTLEERAGNEQQQQSEIEIALGEVMMQVDQVGAAIEQATVADDPAAREKRCWQNILKKIQTQQEYRHYFTWFRLMLELRVVKYRNRYLRLEDTLHLTDEECAGCHQLLRETENTLGECRDELTIYQELMDKFRWSLFGALVVSTNSERSLQPLEQLVASEHFWVVNIALMAYKQLPQRSMELADTLWGQFEDEMKMKSACDTTPEDDLIKALPPLMEIIHSTTSTTPSL